MTNVFMLTTLDNPFDPFNDFKSWYMFDCEKGHNTSSRIARIMQTDGEMSQIEIEAERNRAMDLIMKYDFEDKYIKVSEKQDATAQKRDMSN